MIHRYITTDRSLDRCLLEKKNGSEAVTMYAMRVCTGGVK